MNELTQKYCAFIALAISGVLGVPARAQAAQNGPNIVYIVADDLGWKDVGYHGSDIRTPNIDKLAQDGARLEQFYAQPMCTPTRAALMTGRYPFRYGLQTLVIPSDFTYGLPTDEWLLPQALKEAGYQTAIIGKWHLGHGDPKYWPRQRGFDYQYGPMIGELDYFTHEQHGVLDWYLNNKPIKEKGYTTTLRGNAAVKLIEEHNTAVPLYLYLTFNAPHTPYQATQEYLDQYKNIADPSRRAYAGSITAMDEQIGRVVDAFKKKGIRDNTIIVFQSDNGGTRNAIFAGLREGDWKLIWRAPLPAALELYNIAQDPSEKNNLAAENPDKVAELQKRANELAAVEAKPILLQEIFQDFRKRLAMPPALPGAEYQLDFEQ
jgi:arylsulfatase A-like enzyme